MTTSLSESNVYYDPYDFEIDADPYPMWRRLRDEAPLYYNEKLRFLRVEPVRRRGRRARGLETYRSGRGSVLELIKSNIEIPPGVILFEDPPGTRHPPRSALPRVHAEKMSADRTEGAGVLRPRLSTRSSGQAVSTSSPDLGAEMPMRDDRHAARHSRGGPGGDPRPDRRRTAARGRSAGAELHARPRRNDEFGPYIDWRKDNPSDDLMTELINAEFDDENGTIRRLTRDEIITTSACSPAPATRRRRG